MPGLLPGQQRELDVVEALVHDLPEDWHVFHGIPWQNEANGFLQLGEWDVVVVSPAGHLAILEIKAGEIDWTPKGPVKHYASGSMSRSPVPNGALPWYSANGRRAMCKRSWKRSPEPGAAIITPER